MKATTTLQDIRCKKCWGIHEGPCPPWRKTPLEELQGPEADMGPARLDMGLACVSEHPLKSSMGLAGFFQQPLEELEQIPAPPPQSKARPPQKKAPPASSSVPDAGVPDAEERRPASSSSVLDAEERRPPPLPYPPLDSLLAALGAEEVEEVRRDQPEPVILLMESPRQTDLTMAWLHMCGSPRA